MMVKSALIAGVNGQNVYLASFLPKKAHNIYYVIFYFNYLLQNQIKTYTYTVNCLI